MPSNSVTVTNPTGSSRWYRGQSYNIAWSHTTGFGSTVDHFEVRLYKGSTLDTVITTNDNATPKSWTVPSNQTEGTDYRIQVKMVLTGGGETSYTDYSGYFDIHEKYHVASLSDSGTLSEVFSTPSLDTWRFVKSLSDTATLSETFTTPTTNTWRFVKTLSDSATLSESFATPSVYTYLTSRTLSDSATMSDTFATPTLDTWKHILSNSDSATLSEVLTSSTDTWKHIISNSDSATLSEVFTTPYVYTYLTERSLSDSATLSETFATPVLDTWFHRINVSDTATSSESLASSTYTYLTTKNLSDSSTLSDSLGVTTDYWKIINSITDSASTTESFSAVLEYWRNVVSNNDQITLSDGFTAQLVFDSNSFYYDSISLDTSTKISGYVSSGDWTTSSSLVTQLDGLTDGQTSNPAIFSASTRAGVRFDLGSQKPVDFICVHLQSGETESIKLYGSNAQGTGYALLTTISNGSNTWTINEFDAVNYRYYVIQCEAGTVDCKIDEVIIGEVFKPEVRYDINSSTGLDTSVTKKEGFDGTEYIHKTSDDVKTYDFKYPNISSTLKDNFETMANKTDGKKLLYWDDSVNYINLIPPRFSEISYNRYSADIQFHT